MSDIDIAAAISGVLESLAFGKQDSIFARAQQELDAHPDVRARRLQGGPEVSGLIAVIDGHISDKDNAPKDAPPQEASPAQEPDHDNDEVDVPPPPESGHEEPVSGGKGE